MRLASSSDPELIRRCLEDDGEAWQALIERYARLVCSVPVRMGLAPADVDEVFQDTFIALLAKLSTVRDRARIGLWLAATARRKALDRVSRGPGRHETALLDDTLLVDPTPLAAEQLLRMERQARVRIAVEALPVRCRALFEGLFYADPALSYRDLATRLGIAEGSLGPTRQRCFERLRRALGDSEPARPRPRRR